MRLFTLALRAYNKKKYYCRKFGETMKTKDALCYLVGFKCFVWPTFKKRLGRNSLSGQG